MNGHGERPELLLDALRDLQTRLDAPQVDLAEVRDIVADRIRQAEAVEEIAATGALTGLELTLEQAARLIGETLPVRQVWLRCYAEVHPSRVESVASWPQRQRISADLLEFKRLMIRKAVATGSRTLVVRTDALPRLAAFARPRSGWVASRLLGPSRYLVFVPIRAEEEILGGVVVSGVGGDEAPADRDLETLAAIADELGRIVVRARTYDRERRLVAELQDLDRFRTELIATISHELRTPLTSILGHAEILSDDLGDVGSVGVIRRNAARLDRLVRDLVHYSALQTAQEPLRIPVDLAGLAERSLDRYGYQAEVNGITLSIEHPEISAIVLGDPDELGRVVDNLLRNAVTYTGAGGHVRIELHETGGFVELVCADDGMGISTEDLAHLFTAFHRSSNPMARSIPGSGLGLAISRRVAELHGGAIEVTSRLGEGSVFRLRLPVGDRSGVA